MKSADELPRLEGKTFVVTGATQGVGRVTAETLARKGARVGIVCRNAEKGAEVAAAVPGQIDVFRADLSSLAEVRRVAAEIAARYQRLDVLVNNAGAIFIERVVTVDGLEATFATNHLSYFLLTHLLRPLLERSAPARIVNVASTAHRRGWMDFDDLMFEKGYAGFLAYGRSKLANIMFTYELARRLEGTGVTANCLHPGVVATGFGRGEHTRWLKPLITIARPFFLSAEKGARCQLYLAASPEVDGVSGKYFVRCKPVASRRASYDEAAQQRLWAVSETLCGLA